VVAVRAEARGGSYVVAAGGAVGLKQLFRFGHDADSDEDGGKDEADQIPARHDGSDADHDAKAGKDNRDAPAAAGSDGPGEALGGGDRRRRGIGGLHGWVF